MSSVPHSPPLPASAVALKCLVVGVFLGGLFYAVSSSVFTGWAGNPIVGLVRGFFGTLAMALTMNEVLTKCLLLGLFCVFMASFAVQIRKLSRLDAHPDFSPRDVMIPMVCCALLLYTCFCLYREDDGPTRLKVHAVGAEQAMLEPNDDFSPSNHYPAVDEKWISYFRCERIRKAYVDADPQLRFNLEINGRLVGGESHEVRCQMWDFSRVTITALRPQ